MILKLKKIIPVLIICSFISGVIGTVELVYWRNTNYEVQGNIKKRLVPEFFQPDSIGDVGWKIKNGTIYYRWSVFDQDSIGLWPFIRKAESKNIPDFIKSHM